MSNTKSVSGKRASEQLGVCQKTLRQWAAKGVVPYYRLPNGDRRYDISGFIPKRESTICYARVSTPKQRGDLDRQLESLLFKYPGSEGIKDIGSGLNYKRKGFRAILERAIQGECIKLVITYRDRLARFGFDVFEWIITRAGGEIVVVNKIETSPTTELTQDLLAILTVFSSRMHGLRSNKNKKDIIEAVSRAEKDIPSVDGCI